MAAQLRRQDLASTATECDLAAIWSEAFGLAEIAVDDDFFDLGGDSMLAILIVTLLQERLGVDIETQTFFASPTIRQLARIIDIDRQCLESVREILSIATLAVDDDFWIAGGTTAKATRLRGALERIFDVELAPDLVHARRSSRAMAATVREAVHCRESDGTAALVPLRRQGRGRPLFVMHPECGDTSRHRTSLESVEWNRPVYLTRAPELTWHRDHLSLSEMVALYVSEIRRVQKRGPYVLAGVSFGALLALEVATRLIVGGEEVGLLAIIQARPPRSLPRRLLGSARAALQTALARTSLVTDQRTKRALSAGTLHGQMPPCAGNVPPTGVDDDRVVTLAKARQVWLKNRDLQRTYSIKGKYQGRIVVFGSLASEATRWQRLATHPVDIVRITLRNCDSTDWQCCPLSGVHDALIAFSRMLNEQEFGVDCRTTSDCATD